MKNLIRVLLSPSPLQRPNICQILEEISRMQGVPCPIENFYLERVKNNELLPSQIMNFSMPVTNYSPTRTPATPIKQPPIIQSLKPQMSPTRSYIPTLQYSQTVAFNQPNNILNNPIKQNSFSMRPSKSLTTFEPNLYYHQASPSLQEMSPTKQKTNLFTNQYKEISNHNIYSNVGGTAVSPVRNPLHPVYSNNSSNKYVNSQTQTDNSDAYIESPISSRRSSINRNRSSMSLKPSNITGNDTGGSIVKRLTEQLKRVMTNESISTTPSARTTSRNNTGNSIKSTIEALRSGISGVSNNIRSFSNEHFRTPSSSYHTSAAYKRNTSSDSFLNPDYNYNNSNKLDKRSKYRNVQLPNMNADEHKFNISETNTNNSRNDHITNSHIDKDLLDVPEIIGSFKSPSPIKFTIDTDTKTSIEKRVMALLKAAQNSPVKRTASGYGKYTKTDSQIYQPKLIVESSNNKQLSSNRPDIAKDKPNVSSNQNTLNTVSKRQESVVIKPLVKSTIQTVKLNEVKLPPPVPKKPTFLRSQPSKKLVSEPYTNQKISSKENHSIDGSRKASTESNFSLQSINIDKLEHDFRQRFPSTLQ